MKCKRRRCKYHPGITANNGCDFFMNKGLLRGCPAGAECTRFCDNKIRCSRIDWHKFQEAYEEGLTDREIAAYIGAKTNTVGKYRRDHGLAAHRKIGVKK